MSGVQVRARWQVGLAAAAAVVGLVAGLVVIRSLDERRRPVDDIVPTIDDGTSPAATDGPPDTVPTPDPSPRPTIEPAPPRNEVVSTVSVAWPVGDVESSVPLLEQAITPSSIGDLQWTVFESPSGAESQLRPLQVWRGPQGFVAVHDQQLVFSDNAVSWRVVDSPFPGTPFSVLRTRSGQYQLTTFRADYVYRTWESIDLETWTLALPEPEELISGFVDGPGILTPSYQAFFDPSNLGYQGFVELPNGGALARVSVGLDVGRLAALYGDEQVRERFEKYPSETWVIPSDPDGLSIRRGAAVVATTSWSTWTEAKERSRAAFEVELSISGSADNWTLQVDNAETSEALGTVRGSIGASTLRETLEWLGGAPEAWFVIDGDGVPELVEPDWADSASEFPGAVNFVNTADGLLTYVEADGDGPEVWRTADGRTWERLGVATGLPNVAVRKFLATPGGRYGAIAASTNSPTIVFLTSDDAINWQPASQPPGVVGSDSEIRLTESGFLILNGLDRPNFEAWTSPDGDVWTQVAAGELISRPQSDLSWDGGSRGPTNGAPDRGSTFDVFTVNRSFSDGRVITWVIEAPVVP